MKVLLLGSGQKYQGVSRCHSCMSQEEYDYCITHSEVIRLDIDPTVKPDVVAAVHQEPWADKVLQTGNSKFDVIIDEISYQSNQGTYYQDEARRLLKSDGLFYGWLDHKKVVWINTEKGLVLSQI